MRTTLGLTLIATLCWSGVALAGGKTASPAIRYTLQGTQDRLSTLHGRLRFVRSNRLAPSAIVQKSRAVKVAAGLGLELSGGVMKSTDGRRMRRSLLVRKEVSVGPQVALAVGKGEGLHEVYKEALQRKPGVDPRRRTRKAVPLLQGTVGLTAVLGNQGSLMSMAPSRKRYSDVGHDAKGIGLGRHVGLSTFLQIPLGKSQLLESERQLGFAAHDAAYARRMMRRIARAPEGEGRQGLLRMANKLLDMADKSVQKALAAQSQEQALFAGR